MSTAHDVDYYIENPHEFDALTENEQNHILNGTENSEVTANNDAVEVSESDLDLVLGDVSNQPTDISSKDGIHTIPYKVLEGERANAAAAIADRDIAIEQLRQQTALLAELQAAKEGDKGTGGTDAQDEVLAGFEEEFGEILGDNFKDYLKQVVNAEVKPFKDKADYAEAELRKLEAQQQQAVASQEWDSVKAAHPDVEALIESQAIGKWIESLPEFDQAGKWQVAQSGTASEKIALLTMYKAANGTQQQKPSNTVVQDARIPKTLDNIIGASASIDEAEKFAAMSESQQMVYAMNHPEQIAKLLQSAG